MTACPLGYVSLKRAKLETIMIKAWRPDGISLALCHTPVSSQPSKKPRNPNAGSSVTTYPVDRPSDQRHRLSLGRYVQSSLGRHARLCLSQRSDRPHTACGSVPPAALGPPLPGWPSYSPVSRAMGAARI